MQAISRITGVLLLITAVSVLPGAHLPGFHAFTSSSAQPGRPAGCHSQQPATPTHTPISHQCCASGHNTAIPSAAFSSCPLIARFSALIDIAGISLAALTGLQPAALDVPTDSPPGTVPLRI